MATAPGRTNTCGFLRLGPGAPVLVSFATPGPEGCLWGSLSFLGGLTLMQTVNPASGWRCDLRAKLRVSTIFQILLNPQDPGTNIPTLQRRKLRLGEGKLCRREEP